MSSFNRREWMGAAAGAALTADPGKAAARRPNVILILSDDQGYGDLSLHGNPYLKTPSLDAIARQGDEFTRFYVSPVCAPTRASLLTGRYNLRTGVHGVTHGRETMRTSEVTIAEALRQAGYRTALFGKWHLGEHYPNVPHAQGFDEFVGFRTGHWMNYYDSPVERNGKPSSLKGYITDALTDEALGFVERNRGRPFFLYLAYNVPHSPFQVPRRYFDPFKKQGLDDSTAAVYGMVSNLDENVGRLTRRLDEWKLAGDTILIFLTDNGPATDRYVCGLRGRKASVFEGGVRAPFFIRWPGRLPAGRKVDRIAAHIDMYPTVLELCGVKAPDGPPVDGVSIAPLMKGDAAAWPDRMIFTHQTRPAALGDPHPGAVRTQRFNLVNGADLYDIEDEPGEKTNVAAKHPGKVSELRAAYEAWFKVAADQCGFERMPIPVGHPQEDPVTLAAPQSFFTGSIHFYGKAGYAHDWLTGWTSAADLVYWDIDVARGGRYLVSLRYLCPQEDTGARVAVSAGQASVEGAVSRPTPMSPQPPLAVFDAPGYPIMSFATLELGALALPGGRTKLTVKALSKPGKAVMDLKEVILKRLP